MAGSLICSNIIGQNTKMAFDKDEFGFIAGSKKSKAASMYRRGATRIEVEDATGYARLVVLQELRVMGYDIIKKKVRIGKNRPHFLYTIGGKNDSSRTNE